MDKSQYGARRATPIRRIAQFGAKLGGVMTRIAPLLLMLATAPGCSSQNDPALDRESTNDNPAIDTLFAAWDRPGSPGCAVAVSRAGELIYSRGYGYANLDYDIPITPQTVFDVASVTKQFVAASLSMLALEGRLSFDDDVRKWLPELPEYEQPITLTHMVYHTSGLRDYLNLFPLAGRDDYHPISHDQILDMMVRQQALNFAPGERYEYSNTAYMLLAIVIERVSGMSLGDFVQQRIFDPLKMTGSLMYDDFERVIPRRASGYARDDNGKVRMVHNFNFDVPGDGQMYTTVEDLLRWDNYLHRERPKYYPTIMLEGTLNTGAPIGRAKGLFLDEYRGLQTVHHTGSSWGFRTVVKRLVKPDLAIAIACNDDNAYPRDLAFRIADHYLADELGPVDKDEPRSDSPGDESSEPAAAPVNPDQLADFAGSFHSAELDAIYRFVVIDDQLLLRIEQEPPMPVSFAGPDTCEFDFHPQGWSGPSRVRLEFSRDDGGDVAGFLLNAGTETGIVFEEQQ